MAGKDSVDMELWLSELLNSVGVDGEVYGEYISGTLATMEESSQSEMEEALVDILTGCVVSVRIYSRFGLVYLYPLELILQVLMHLSTTPCMNRGGGR